MMVHEAASGVHIVNASVWPLLCVAALREVLVSSGSGLVLVGAWGVARLLIDIRWGRTGLVTAHGLLVLCLAL